MAEQGTVPLNGEQQNAEILQDIPEDVALDLVQIDIKPREEMVNNINGLSIYSDAILNITAKMFEAVMYTYRDILNIQGALGDNDVPSLYMKNRRDKKGEPVRIVLIKDIVDLYSYAAMRTPLFPREKHSNNSRYVEIINIDGPQPNDCNVCT